MHRFIKLALLTTLYFGSAHTGFAQTGPGSGNTDPNASANSQAQRRADTRDANRRLMILNDIERQIRRPKEQLAVEPKFVVDKGTQERVELLRRVTQKDAAPYLELLKGKDAGIFKMFPNLGCVTNKVVRVDGECAEFVPLSSHASLRLRTYIDEPYQDFEYVDGEIRANGFFAQGMIRDLGDIPLTVAISDQKLAAAIKTIGAGDAFADDAKATTAKLSEGYTVEGTTFTNRAKAVVGHTYILRSIAYKAKVSLPPASTSNTPMQLQFHGLTFDDRADLTVVFRILSRDTHGGLTIVWKELDRTEAPKLKFAKGQPLGDFK